MLETKAFTSVVPL